MQYSSFLDWLVLNRNMKKRSAKDVVSRCKRIVSMLSSDEIDSTTISRLNADKTFSEKSVFIRSQLRRAATLYVEFCDAIEGTDE